MLVICRSVRCPLVLLMLVLFLWGKSSCRWPMLLIMMLRLCIGGSNDACLLVFVMCL